MRCPNCKSNLEKVIVKCHYGINIELNQCLNCGGIWCDDFEMYRVSLKSAKDIDRLDLKKLTDLNIINDKLICPRCGILLKEFKDPYFPKQIKLEYCSKCGGFWLNRGELIQFKEWQKKKKDKSKKEISNKNKELLEQMDKLLAFNKNQSLETWGKIGRFLNQSVSRENIPYVNSSTGIIGFIIIILQIIFNSMLEFKKTDFPTETRSR